MPIYNIKFQKKKYIKYIKLNKKCQILKVDKIVMICK